MTLELAQHYVGDAVMVMLIRPSGVVDLASLVAILHLGCASFAGQNVMIDAAEVVELRTSV